MGLFDWRSARRAEKTTGNTKGRPHRAAQWVMALEPRMMFDGAAVADAVQAAAVRMRSMPPMDGRE